MDVFGKALKDYYQGNRTNKLWLHNDYGEPEEMPLDIFFRQSNDLPKLEQLALNMCEGSILDIGAGAGCHSLILQTKGFNVTALEISDPACEIMRNRGIMKIINKDILQYQGEKFDTLLLLMNGIGLCEDLNGLHTFLQHMKKLSKPDSQLIFDSSDISYLYADHNMPRLKYYGEISYQYEYQNIKGNWFKWLFIDYTSLAEIAAENGWFCQLIYEDDMDQYLVRLTLKDNRLVNPD